MIHASGETVPFNKNIERDVQVGPSLQQSGAKMNAGIAITRPGMPVFAGYKYKRPKKNMFNGNTIYR